ncbi:hypothetical protein F0562_014766 [Nyssa sinensis]|uniref:Uncharacterized protein n=1 Tax=Nyssa sinensis TaxID=561372 RepID=A0A5J4ZPT8_9ASTE|nr:hypothetical protein F0562_014766 [Nyssa sinensis]
MKLVWSPETASKAYIDTVKSCKLFKESGVAEFISAMAGGWNAKLIVEAWSHGGAVTTSVGLAVAARHTGGRHVCMVSNERSRLERKDFAKVLRFAKLSQRGAVLVCKNASQRTMSGFRWSGVLDSATRVVRSVVLPVGKGLDIAYVENSSGAVNSTKGPSRWIRHIDQQSGEEHIFRG